jgi:checkpoint serine/threonine-protein kinase
MQSLDKKTISSSHIAIRHAQHQVTVNARGQKERVFVDLREVYPTPEEPGTELSFEEIWARRRGWLDMTWPDDTIEEESTVRNENDETNVDVDLLADAVSEKLVVRQDVIMLDENGAPIFPNKTKTKKKKVMEVNETQISESACAWLWLKCVANTKQSKRNWTHRLVPSLGRGMRLLSRR